MVNIGETGRICLNQERQGACENCLWWEWDAASGECGNSHYHICPLYRERLFNQKARLSGARQASPPAANGDSVDQPGVKAEESGTS